MNQVAEFKESLAAHGIEVLENVNVSVGLRIKPVTVDFLIRPKTKKELLVTLRLYRMFVSFTPITVVGLRTATVFAGHFGGIVIDTSDYRELTIDNTRVTASAGTALSQLAWESSVQLTGLEQIVGIPGTVGGALHASSQLLQNLDYTVEIFDLLTGEIKKLYHQAEDIDFGYSIFSANRNYVILSATFQLAKATTTIDPTARLRKNVQENMIRFPLHTPSIYVFKENRQRLKEMKLTCNGISFSQKHLGFLLNTDRSTTWEDVIYLLSQAHNNGVPSSTSYLQIITAENAWVDPNQLFT